MMKLKRTKNKKKQKKLALKRAPEKLLRVGRKTVKRKYSILNRGEMATR